MVRLPEVEMGDERPATRPKQLPAGLVRGSVADWQGKEGSSPIASERGGPAAGLHPVRDSVVLDDFARPALE